MEPRELALREVRDSPWLQQRDLATRLAGQTGLAESTLIRLFRRMEAEGELQSGLDGRRKTYALPEPPSPPTEGALWSASLARLGEPEPEPEAEPVPAGDQRKPAWSMAAVVAIVLAGAVLAAVVLSPEKRDPFTGGDPDADAKPVKAAPPPEPAPKREEPKPEARPDPGLAAAKKTRIAVLSGVAAPGAAAKEGKRLKAEGFRIGTVSNAPGPAQRSAVLYASGERAAAAALAEEAGIESVKSLDPETADAARGAELVVVVGDAR